MKTRSSAIAFALVLLFCASLCPSPRGMDSGEAAQPEIETIAEAVAGVMYDYRDYSQIKAELLSIELSYPDIVEIIDIGDSWEKTQGLADRDILAVKISDNVGVDEDEPEVMIVGLHHAREWSTSELVLAIVRNLTSGYGEDTRISWLVDNREIWIVPVVNPDGLDYALSSDQWWRKNRRLNYDGTYGVDLNRNYDGSQNGDPEGEWGGAGTSHIPSYETYCGVAPFSEPETQAVRDLVYQRDFEIALDFHSYGNWVMWPWSYSTDITVDDADLVRIGTELAAINGYTPAQSVDMYATTGDSLDWLYGAENIYPILFEVGDEFHPAKTVDVETILQDNLPAAMHGIEIAGDREARAFSIAHEEEVVRTASVTGFRVNATIVADRGVNTDTLTLFYRINGGEWFSTAMVKSSGNDTYSGIVPSQPAESIVEYYVFAQDMGGIELMSPQYSPYEVYSFLVSPAGINYEIIWNPPASIDGSVTNSIDVEARNLSAGAALVFYMLNGTLYYTTTGEPVVGSPGNYTIAVAQGLPLGVYELWLVSEVGGVPEYESESRLTEVVDATPPLIYGHGFGTPSGDVLHVNASCSDLYGVVSVVVEFREKGESEYDSLEMTLYSGSSENGSWEANITLPGGTVIEYRFVAYQADGLSSVLPESGWFEHAPIPEMPVVFASLAVALLVVVVLAVSRARRA